MSNPQLYVTAAEAIADLSGVQDAVLRLLGVALILFVAFRMFASWARRDYGTMVVELLAAVVAGLFILFPDRGIALISSLINLIFP